MAAPVVPVPAAAASVPLSVLGLFGMRISDTQAFYLLSAVCQAAGAIVALVLTANILFTQLQTYALPVRFLVLWDRWTKLTYSLLAAATLFPALLLLFGWYAPSDIAVGLFASSLGVLGFYVRSRPKSVSLDRFFDEMVGHPRLRAASIRELYHMCVAALDRRDLDTFRKAALLLFSVDEPSDALYQFWNTVVERAQDEPEAITPFAEAIYGCASPLAANYVIAAAAGRSSAGVPNRLFSATLAQQSPHYLARLLLLCGDRPQGTLVRQEVLENLLLIVLDLLAVCTDEQLAPLGDDVIPTLLGYLDQAEDDILLRVLRGDAIYHYLLFALPAPERFSPASRRDLDAARRRAWDRIVAYVYRDHEWHMRTNLTLALWRDGEEELETVHGPAEVEAVIGEASDDGLTCEWRPPRRGGLRDLLPTRRG